VELDSQQKIGTTVRIVLPTPFAEENNLPYELRSNTSR